MEQRNHSTSRTSQARQTKAARDRRNSDQIREGLVAAWEAVKRERSENGGVYPFNKGKVSLAEVARRAGVHVQTPFKSPYREVASFIVQEIKSLDQQAQVGKQRPRKTAEARAAHWKLMFERSLEQLRLAEVDLLHSIVQSDERKPGDGLNVVQFRPGHDVV